MSGMFREASAFNWDIGVWDTSGVTTMREMFYDAVAFNQDLGGWKLDGVADMIRMFQGASAFDQDLGWCIDDDVSLGSPFSGTQCASTFCGVSNSAAALWCGGAMDDSSIHTAVKSWLSNSAAAEATYGHISTWETGEVTNMGCLFGGAGYPCYGGHNGGAFNDDIGAWDTSGVTTMHRMFEYATAFNQDIGGWAVHNVTNTYLMFHHASSFNQDLSDWTVERNTYIRHMFDNAVSFNQDLGWCVIDGGDSYGAFIGTPCQSTSCGVDVKGVSCALPSPAPTTTHAPTPAPTTPAPTALPRTSSSSGGGGGATALIAGVAAAAALLLALVAFWFYRRRKASMIDKIDEPPAPDEATTPKKEEATIPIAPEGEEASTEQPPPPPPRRWFSRAEPEPEAAALKAEEMYNQIAAWYNEPENAALREIWGAYPGPDEFQTWSGFVAVTNAFLDREAVWGEIYLYT